MKKILATILFLLLPLSTQALTFTGASNMRVSNLATGWSFIGVTTASFSFGGWFKPSSCATDLAGMTLDGTVTGLRIVIRSSGTKWAFQVVGGSTLATAATGTCVPNVWQHIFVTYNSSGAMILYINGTSAATATSANLDSHTYSNAIIMGSGGAYYSGDISDVRVYNRTLSANEVRSIYYGIGTRSGLVGYYPLAGTAGTYNADFSGNGNFANAINSPVRGALSPSLRFRH
jgi:hypothetical protein